MLDNPYTGVQGPQAQAGIFYCVDLFRLIFVVQIGLTLDDFKQ